MKLFDLSKKILLRLRIELTIEYKFRNEEFFSLHERHQID